MVLDVPRGVAQFFEFRQGGGLGGALVDEAAARLAQRFLQVGVMKGMDGAALELA